MTTGADDAEATITCLELCCRKAMACTLGILAIPHPCTLSLDPTVCLASAGYMDNSQNRLLLIDESNVDGELAVPFEELFCAIKRVNKPKVLVELQK